MNKLRLHPLTDESVKSDLKAIHPPHLAKEIEYLYLGTFGSSDLQVIFVTVHC
jgi:hypothetical protein